MKISTRGRYALRMMQDLALNGGGGPVRLKDVAQRQEISEKYCEQIIAILNKAGFVRSVRGPQGGYSLSHEPSYYTAGMILRLTEGPLSVVDCVGDDGACNRTTDCASRILWDKLSKAIDDVVDGVTLQDLLDWSPNSGDDYVI